jgi:Flp pilus assembly pilin Flp
MRRQGVVGMLCGHAREVLAGEEGQGTTEYAILVGVLVVIAIVAILAFRDKVSELWSAIADGINSL